MFQSPKLKYLVPRSYDRKKAELITGILMAQFTKWLGGMVILCYSKPLFGCCQIHLNPRVLRWIGLEFTSNSTPVPPPMWIHANPNISKQGLKGYPVTYSQWRI